MVRRMAPIVVVALAGGCAARDQVTCARDDECPPRASCAEGVCVATSDRDTVGIAPGAVEDPGEGEGEPTPPSSGGTGGVFDNGYAARLPLTLDGAFVAGSEPLVDFPVWIDVRAPELRARDAGGLLERRGGAVDVEVTTTEGESVAVEVVDLDDVGGRLRAWLRVPWLTQTRWQLATLMSRSARCSACCWKCALAPLASGRSCTTPRACCTACATVVIQRERSR